MNSYYLPPEWHPHEATWLTWPSNEETWPTTILTHVEKEYLNFVQAIAQDEPVNLLVQNLASKQKIESLIQALHNQYPIRLMVCQTNDAWIRDYGPDFVLKNGVKHLINWQYNAWGEKYPPFQLDNSVPDYIAKHKQIPSTSTNMILEGGSIETNGTTLLTTKECLLNPNRNPLLSKKEIEANLKKYFGINEIIWLSGNIIGDDTDGHIDNIARFINETTILAGTESNSSSPNYHALMENMQTLKNKRKFQIIEIPMPPPYQLNQTTLPASYLNFYITNQSIIVPMYGFETDQTAIDIISRHAKERSVIGLPAHHIIWGQGSFHCLSKQELAL